MTIDVDMGRKATKKKKKDQTYNMCVAPIIQVMHMYNKNSNNQGRSPNVVKVIFHIIRNCS